MDMDFHDLHDLHDPAKNGVIDEKPRPIKQISWEEILNYQIQRSASKSKCRKTAKISRTLQARFREAFLVSVQTATIFGPVQPSTKKALRVTKAWG
jgi:hypothetical protein